MNDELLPYYEQELTFIRQMAAEFKEKYPAVAGRLMLEPNMCEDPHVERLIEAFALLTGRIRHKLDDEFPEITEALLSVLYPHYLNPVPSQAIVQFRSDPTLNAVPAPIELPVGTALHTKPDDGNVCSFRTCYPTQVLPLQVCSASLSASSGFAGFGSAGVAANIRIQMECLGELTLCQLPLEKIRFYLNGETAAVHSLYEFLFLNALHVTVRAIPAAGGTQVVLPATNLRQVGFSRDEGMLPYSRRSFLGYRLLQEYFSFPEKFLFFDLVGLNQISLAGFGKEFEIVIALREADYQHRLTLLEQSVTAETFQLGCSPVVNLYERLAEPIRISHTRTEYQVVGDQHHQQSTEIYSIDRVNSLASYRAEPITYAPLYSLRHRQQSGEQHFWYAHRRPSMRKDDEGTDVFISLADDSARPGVPQVDLLNVYVTCTNRDYANRLRVSGEYKELETNGAGLVHARFLQKPSRALRPPLRRASQWRLVSHLSLNYLSIVDRGREALQEILRLYHFNNDPAIRKQIGGIAGVHSKAAVSRVLSETGVTFCRGTEVTIDFDENEYVGAGVFLFASVLERFLGLYAAVNSFSRLTAKTSKGTLKRWQAVTGEQILL